MLICGAGSGSLSHKHCCFLRIVVAGVSEIDKCLQCFAGAQLMWAGGRGGKKSLAPRAECGSGYDVAGGARLFTQEGLTKRLKENCLWVAGWYNIQDLLQYIHPVEQMPFFFTRKKANQLGDGGSRNVPSLPALMSKVEKEGGRAQRAGGGSALR